MVCDSIFSGFRAVFGVILIILAGKCFLGFRLKAWATINESKKALFGSRAQASHQVMSLYTCRDILLFYAGHVSPVPDTMG